MTSLPEFLENQLAEFKNKFPNTFFNYIPKFAKNKFFTQMNKTASTANVHEPIELKSSVRR